jgi:hypothetical protein
MPVPEGTRFRFKTVSPTARVRMAYLNNKRIEVTSYVKKNGKFVKSHTRRYPRK